MSRPLQDMTNEELWALFPVILREHDPVWAEWFSEERRTLEAAVGTGRIVGIHHIGSTAVPGLLAKPTVDILLEVKEGIVPEELIADIVSAGYLYTEQPDKPAPHMMFMKGYTPDGFGERVFHLHVRYGGDWDELWFRDYLKTHPETAAAYAGLKQELKVRYEHDRDAYTDAKTDFVRRITRLAREESSPTPKDRQVLGD